MMSWWLLAGAGMGFLGSAHCVGMCGGIAGALSMLGPARRDAPFRIGHRQALYSVGRVLSYSMAGALAGAFGVAVAAALGPRGALLLRGAAATLLILLGLYLAGWWSGLAAIERAGARVWRRIAPLARRVGTGGAWHAVALGMLWGGLPCGLVYSGLALAASSGGAVDGAVLMAGFGLGTLPAVLATGMLMQRVTVLSRAHASRRIAGVLLLVFGVWIFAAGRVSVLGGGPACHPAADSQLRLERIR